jgi:hypothetical protein
LAPGSCPPGNNWSSCRMQRHMDGRK